MSFDPYNFREQFPLLQKLHPSGNPLIYWDNAATTQKPQCVIDSMVDYLTTSNANIHRGVYFLSEKSDFLYESTRKEIAEYIHAASEKEIVYTSGTTESINLVAHGFRGISRNDEVILFVGEHHANILPWIERGLSIKVVPMNFDGCFDLDAFKKMISNKTKLVAVAQMTNVLGAENPIEEIVKISHSYGAYVLVDGAQSLVHQKIDVRQMDCDFFVASAHKAFGPTGIGFLYAKGALLDQILPLKLGGGIVKKVTFDNVLYKSYPEVLEAGTPNTLGIAGMKAMIAFLKKIDWNDAEQFIQQLTLSVKSIFSEFPRFSLLKPNSSHSGIVSFIHKDIHPHDIASIFDTEGIAIRAGSHCAQPLMDFLGVHGTARISLTLYNTPEEVEILRKVLRKTEKVMGI